MRLAHKIIFTALITLFVASIGVACERASKNTPTPPATIAPTATPQPTPTPRRGVTLPPESRVLYELRTDFITGGADDGFEERVVAFRRPSGDGLAIDGWQVELPAGYQVEDLQVRVLDMEKRPKVLLFTAGDDGISHYLYIYGWDGTTFVVQGPHDGPLDGQPAFRSAYYRTHVEDGDFDGNEEVMIFREASNPNYVEVLFYEWLDGAFRYTTRFIAIPRRVPTPAAPKGD